MGLESFQQGRATQEKHDVVVAAQLRGIRREVGSLGLNHLYHTEPSTSVRVASFYKGTRLVGVVEPIHSNNVALMLASTNRKVAIKRVLIAPTEGGSRLFRDSAGRPHTDSFITVEGNTIRHVRTDKPVELAAVEGYEPGRPGFELAEPEVTGRFARTANHKEQTKQILAAARIHVPRGIHITDLTDTDTVLDRCRTFHRDLVKPDGQRDIVLKPESETANGDYVVMGNPGDDSFIDSAKETLQSARKMGLSVIVEERIDSCPQPGLAEYNRQLCLAAGTPEDRIPKADELDYNFRELFTVGEEPIFVDDEIRYDERNHKPVNVNKTAEVARTDVIEDRALVAKVRETARQAIAATYKHVKEAGDPEAIPEMAGVDCTVDLQGNVYVWEVQWGPGGVGSLTKIDKRPPSSIRRVLVPYLDTTIASQQTQPGHEVAALSQIPHTPQTMHELAFELYDSGRFREAEILWWATFDLHPLQYPIEESNLRWMNILARETGHYQRALDYAAALVNKEPDNERYEEYRNKFEAGKKLSEIDKLMTAGEYAEAHELFYHSDLLRNFFGFFDDVNFVKTMEHIARETGQYSEPSVVTKQLVEFEPDNEIFRRVQEKFEAGAALCRVVDHIEDEEYTAAHDLLYSSARVLDAAFTHFDPEAMLEMIETIASNTGQYRMPLHIAQQLVNWEPDNTTYQRYLTLFQEGFDIAAI